MFYYNSFFVYLLCSTKYENLNLDFINFKIFLYPQSESLNVDNKVVCPIVIYTFYVY
jgi:hypothetical protein